MQPELAIALAETLSTCQVGLTMFGSLSAILAGLARWTVSETLLVASGLTGCIMLLRSLALAKPVLVWLEVLTNRDINQDGVIGEPEPKPAYDALPSSNWANDAHATACRLWDYTHAQVRAANADGRELAVKPWARRQGHGLSNDEWSSAIDVWVAGGLLKDRKARELSTTSYKRGLDCIREGMTALNFIRMVENDRVGWMPR